MMAIIQFDIPRDAMTSSEDAEKFGIEIDADKLVEAIREDGECQDDLIRAIVDQVAASDFLCAIENKAAELDAIHGDDDKVRPLTERGQVYVNVFTARACALGDIPDDYETVAVKHFAADVDRLHEMLCDGRTADARDLLRAMLPDHRFVSDAALLRLAADRSARLL